ncbi:hypothetical protein JHL17_29665 [Azospirillum sp. YIM B02556]|uniref:PepSY domain-containing protein n=1 Tax=Azospirillum endophyticum TaxID=2800326 RepID=A0ABS1FDQ6_9PROT|nr:hypothetical protein [Azospirillum endophyticum]MBK1841576.1 hypothetical protein [Azospirillum endophyticum]
MKTRLILAAVAASFAAAPAAMAQQSYSQSYAGSQSHSGAYSGSTGGDMSGSTAMGSAGSAGRTASVTAARRGSGQKPIELQQTTLLNQLSAAGYVSVRDFRKDGQRYVASALTRQGEWTTVVLDPRNPTTNPTAAPVR